MNYEKEYNDLIARINAVKNTPEIGMKGKHHYDGYVESGIRDALNYILNPESKDERIRTRLIALVEAFGQGEYKDEMLAYLERQKEQKPAELSEEDEEYFRNLTMAIDATFGEGNTKNWLQNRFKLLYPQPHWKPSEEQMEALEKAWLECDSKETSVVLSSLMSDLQKLL